MNKCHGCSRELSPWRRFFWAPRTTVKLDGFEGFSNITHTDRCIPKYINMFFTCHFDVCKYVVSCSILALINARNNGPGVNKNLLLKTCF